jgi:hypothetical protein
VHVRLAGLLRGRIPHELNAPTAIDHLEEPHPIHTFHPPRFAAARRLPILIIDQWRIVHGRDQFHSTGNPGVTYRLGDCRPEGLIEGLFRRPTTAENDTTNPTIPATGQGVAVEFPDVFGPLLVRRLAGDLQVLLVEVRRLTPTESGYHRAEAAHLVHPLDVVHPHRPLLHQDHGNVWIKEQSLASLPSQIG